MSHFRCVLEAIECLRDAKRLPEPLCYFPAVVEYTVDPFNLKLSRTKDNSPKGLDVFESPSIGSDKLLTVDFPADPKPAWIKIRCEGQWAFSSDGVWLDVLEV